MNLRHALFGIVLIAVAAGGCKRDGEASLAAAAAAGAPPHMVVWKTPACGCCDGWVEHVREAGFSVEVHELDNLNDVKRRAGVPYGMGSCHTAEIEGYFIEGHVPASDIRRLLAERPAVKGLTLPGMPIGSPGMEDPSGRVEPYTVVQVGKDGSTSEFARHGPNPRSPQ